MLTALILSSITTITLNALVTQLVVQRRIVFNFAKSWQTLHELEQDLNNFLQAKPLVNSMIVHTSATELQIYHRDKPGYKIIFSVSPSNPPKILKWKF